jgi:hypothetical protein
MPNTTEVRTNGDDHQSVNTHRDYGVPGREHHFPRKVHQCTRLVQDFCVKRDFAVGGQARNRPPPPAFSGPRHLVFSMTYTPLESVMGSEVGSSHIATIGCVDATTWRHSKEMGTEAGPVPGRVGAPRSVRAGRLRTAFGEHEVPQPGLFHRGPRSTARCAPSEPPAVVALTRFYLGNPDVPVATVFSERQFDPGLLAARKGRVPDVSWAALE